MSDWLNHVTINVPRNGTTSHTCDPSNATGGGAVAGGTAFTPTAGRLLVVYAYGAVTFTTPAGWTLPTGGSAVNSGGLYVFYKLSAAGSDTFTTTQNATNYAVVFDVYEFGSGSTFKAVAGATAVAPAGGAGPNLTSLTGTNWIAAVVGMAAGVAAAATSGSTTWASGTEVTDTFVAAGGITDGYEFSTAEFNSDVSTSKSDAATVTTNTTAGADERLMVAFTPSGVAAPAIPPELVMAPRRP